MPIFYTGLYAFLFLNYHTTFIHVTVCIVVVIDSDDDLGDTPVPLLTYKRKHEQEHLCKFTFYYNHSMVVGMNFLFNLRPFLCSFNHNSNSNDLVKVY